jgi:hypothetical protein
VRSSPARVARRPRRGKPRSRAASKLRRRQRPAHHRSRLPPDSAQHPRPSRCRSRWKRLVILIGSPTSFALPTSSPNGDGSAAWAAPAAKLRAEVVPAPPSAAAPRIPSAPQLELDLWGPTAHATPRRKPWAWLLKHVFAEDLAACERCGGPTRWLEVATTPEHIASLLARHGVGSPARSPPRAPDRPRRGQPELGFA